MLVLSDHGCCKIEKNAEFLNKKIKEYMEVTSGTIKALESKTHDILERRNYMKVYETKKIPATNRTYVKTRKCDLCGVTANGNEWESTSTYHINETEIKIEIRQKEGNSYPEGGSGTKYEIDLCSNCFKDQLIPWLKAQGANIQQEEWETY